MATNNFEWKLKWSCALYLVASYCYCSLWKPLKFWIMRLWQVRSPETSRLYTQLITSSAKSFLSNVSFLFLSRFNKTKRGTHTCYFCKVKAFYSFPPAVVSFFRFYSYHCSCHGADDMTSVHFISLWDSSPLTTLKIKNGTRPAARLTWRWKFHSFPISVSTLVFTSSLHSAIC